MSTPASTSGCSGGGLPLDVQGAIRTRGSAKFFHGWQRPADSQPAGDMHIGVGLTYNIASVVEPLVRQGLLEPCVEGLMPESPGLFIYFPSRKQMLPKLRAFVEFWKEFGGRQIDRL